MIKPTIFIGLGTTGTNILKTFRELISEEYSNAGLPIFRYVAIDTTEYETGDNLPQLEAYERISVVNATIESLAPIQSRLNPNQPLYNPHLADWLSPELLSFTQDFKDGARNIRMAGRLCLWENWEEIFRTLSNAHNYIINGANIHRTQEILHQHYESKNLNVPNQLVDNHGINVYVFGSLCGGTCGGMLIDTAYLLRNLLGIGNHNNIYGVFTMFDRALAVGIDKDLAVRAANCYASLSELNYYNHPDTTYDITFPNGIKVETRQKPFDYTMLVSPTGKLPHIRFVSQQGEVDEEGLNLMVALNLFAETVSDIGGQRGVIRGPLLAFPGFGALKPISAGKIPTMVRCLASFGLTAVWYPKYRIASAAACFASTKLCTSLKGKYTSDADIRADTINEWYHIRENIDILTSPQVTGQPSLMNEIKISLDTTSKIFNQEVSSQELKHRMNAFPGGAAGPFRSMFEYDGKYFVWMNAKLDECEEAILSAIDKSLDNQLAKIDTHSTYGLDDVRAFFEELDRIIEQALQQCPSRLPTLDLNALNFEPMRYAEKNIWLKITGRQKRMVKAHQDRLIEKYHQLIVGKEGILQTVRNYFLRQVLEAARAKLGFAVDADGPTINKQLRQIEVNLNNCEQTLQEDYEYGIEPPTYSCVKIITNNSQNSIQADAESLSNQIIDDTTPEELLNENGNPIEMADFLKKGHDKLMLQLTETYRRSALNKINDVGSNGPTNGLVVTKAQEILNTDGDNLRDLARRSNPYIEFTPMYNPIAFDRGRQIIFGHDPTGQRLAALRDSLGFERIGHSSVDNFLFFYEEEAGFAMDDLNAFVMLEEHYLNKPGVYGHLTHHNADFYDLALYHKTQKLQQWCRALERIVPEIQNHINKNAFTAIFHQTNSGYVYEYIADGLSEQLALHGESEGTKKLAQKINESEYNNFIRSVRTCFVELDRQQVTKLISNLLRSVEDDREHMRLNDFFRRFLNDVYSNDAATENTDSNAVTASSFFDTPPQTHQPEPDNPRIIQTQNVVNENVENETAETDAYEIASTDEDDSAEVFHNQLGTEHN